MLSDISLGRYVSGESPIHRLDPRTKTIATLVIAVGMVQGVSLVGTAWHIVVALCVIAFARLPWRYVARSLRPFIWLFAIVLASHVLINGAAGWITGIAFAGRLVAMIALASLLSWTTQPLAIVAGLRSLGSPLARIRVPVEAGATAIGLALRFAPIALDEAQNIIRAQAARGADFRGIRRKLALIIPLLGTLFERSFDRADILAEAMEARGYSSGTERTHYRRLGFTAVDLVAVGVVAAWLGVAIVVERAFHV